MADSKRAISVVWSRDHGRISPRSTHATRPTRQGDSLSSIFSISISSSASIHMDRHDTYRPAPHTFQLTPFFAVLPPLFYLLALLLLPPFSSKNNLIQLSVKIIRTILALTAATLFITLPLCFHVKGISSLTYLLALIGCFGFCRVVDIFFINAKNVPRRIQRKLLPPHMAATGQCTLYFFLFFELLIFIFISCHSIKYNRISFLCKEVLHILKIFWRENSDAL